MQPSVCTFQKPCSPVFLDNYEQNKPKKFLHTFVDIAKETVCEKIQREETLSLDKEKHL